jgi:hypothetical protein
MQSLDTRISTSGDGYWSNAQKTVNVTGYTVDGYHGDEFGELRVYFNTKDWNVDNNGLIYTDSLFLEEIRDCFATDDITYSEQGMQGDNFVSFDVGSEFLKMYGGWPL